MPFGSGNKHGDKFVWGKPIVKNMEVLPVESLAALLEAIDEKTGGSEMSKVSIIMPVYNAERYLREPIESVLRQTYTDFELLLINDRSTDNSGAICREYGE